MTTSTALLVADLTGVAVFAASGASAAVAKRLDLFGVVFVGATIGVAKNAQIQVDFFYRHMPAALGRWLSRAVDVLRVAQRIVRLDAYTEAVIRP